MAVLVGILLTAFRLYAVLEGGYFGSNFRLNGY